MLGLFVIDPNIGMIPGWHGHFSPQVLSMAMPLDVGEAEF
jgi:hypothetical protein